jgi:hypothetical protein
LYLIRKKTPMKPFSSVRFRRLKENIKNGAKPLQNISKEQMIS